MSVEERKRPANANLVVGAVLIVVGAVLILGQVLGLNLGQYMWPFFIIVPGVLMLLLAFRTGNAAEGLSIAGSIVTMVGLLLLYQNTTNHWESWAYAWALVAPTSVGLGQILFGTIKGRSGAVDTGKRLVTIGCAIFLVGAIFFELVIGISGHGLGRIAFPIIVIGVGIFLLLRNLVFRRAP
jgi:hypothetical protein